MWRAVARKRVHAAVLAHPDRSYSALARLVGLSRAVVTVACEELAQLGVVEISTGHVRKVHARHHTAEEVEA